MTFIYNRKIEIRRSRNIANPNQGFGGVGYSGRDESEAVGDNLGEVVLISDIPASIQSRGIGRASVAQILPGNVSKSPQWRIYTQAGIPPKGFIRDNDIIIDDEGYRYQVAMAYWTPMGYTLETVRLET